MNTEKTLVYKDMININYFECDFRNHWKPSAIFQHLTETAGRHADKLGFGIEKMAELTNLMLIAQPIVIYCWLPLVSLLENYDERRQVFSAYEASQILTRYNEAIDQYPLNLLTNKLVFNYSQDSDYREIDLKLEKIL